MAWVGIGCGGLLLIAVVAGFFVVRWGMGAYKEAVDELTLHPQKVVAEKVVEMHPELEWVAENDQTGEITIRNKATGEESTISYEDLAAGKVSILGEDGSAIQMGSTDLGELPAWVAKYPGAKDLLLPFHREQSGQVSGMLSFTTNDPPDAVVAFYESKSGSSFTSSSSMNIGDIEHASKSFRDGKQTVSVFTQRKAGSPTRVQVTYEEAP